MSGSVKSLSKMNRTVVFTAAVCCLLHSGSDAQGIKIPVNDAAISGAINRVDPVPFTPEELAVPPIGEIKKAHLREVNAARVSVQQVISGVPQAQQSLDEFTLVKDMLQNLEALAINRQQSILFGLIPKVMRLNRIAGIETSPAFVLSASSSVSPIKASIIREMADYIAGQNATISSNSLALFVSAFSEGSLIEPGDWEGEVIPVSMAGIMILDASAVVSQIKMQPWQNADRFLGGATAGQAFAQYESAGNGIPALKARYVANRSAIVAKWNELADWVAGQRAANP